MVVEAEIFPAVLTCLKDPDDYVKKNVATLIREIAKHTPEVLWNNTVNFVSISPLDENAKTELLQVWNIRFC